MRLETYRSPNGAPPPLSGRDSVPGTIEWAAPNPKPLGGPTSAPEAHPLVTMPPASQDEPQAPQRARKARPAKGVATADVDRIWKAYRSTLSPQANERPAKEAAALIGGIILGADGYSIEDVLLVFEWARHGGDQRSRFLRENGYTKLQNLLVRSKFSAKLEDARKWKEKASTMLAMSYVDEENTPI